MGLWSVFWHYELQGRKAPHLHWYVQGMPERLWEDAIQKWLALAAGGELFGPSNRKGQFVQETDHSEKLTAYLVKEISKSAQIAEFALGRTWGTFPKKSFKLLKDFSPPEILDLPFEICQDFWLGIQTVFEDGVPLLGHVMRGFGHPHRVVMSEAPASQEILDRGRNVRRNLESAGLPYGRFTEWPLSGSERAISVPDGVWLRHDRFWPWLDGTYKDCGFVRLQHMREVEVGRVGYNVPRYEFLEYSANVITDHAQWKDTLSEFPELKNGWMPPLPAGVSQSTNPRWGSA